MEQDFVREMEDVVNRGLPVRISRRLTDLNERSTLSDVPVGTIRSDGERERERKYPDIPVTVTPVFGVFFFFKN